MTQVLFAKRLPSVLRRSAAVLQRSGHKAPKFSPTDVSDAHIYVASRKQANLAGRMSAKDRALLGDQGEKLSAVGQVAREGSKKMTPQPPAPRAPRAVRQRPAPFPAAAIAPKRVVPAPKATQHGHQAPAAAYRKVPARPAPPSQRNLDAAAHMRDQAHAQKVGAAKAKLDASEAQASSIAADRRRKRRVTVGSGVGAAATAATVGGLALKSARRAAPVAASHSSSVALPVAAGAGAGVGAGVLVRSRRQQEDRGDSINAPSALGNPNGDVGKALVSLMTMAADTEVSKAAFARDDDLSGAEGTTIGAGGVGAAVAARELKPTPGVPLSRRGKKVHRKLANSDKTHFKLKPKDWAEISGGRGPRKMNDEYTARMTLAMKKGKLPPGGTRVKVYGDTVKQMDGIHRAQASSMLGRRVKVEVGHRTNKKAPKYPAWYAHRENRGTMEQRARLRDLGKVPTRELRRQAAAYKEGGSLRAEIRSRAERVVSAGVNRDKGVLTGLKLFKA